jgi:DNA repair protein RadC
LLVDAGVALGIEVLDHLVLGESPRYYSFRDAGQMPSSA